MRVSGQLRVEDELLRQAPRAPLPELDEAEDLVSLVVLANLGVRVAENTLAFILGEERENSLLTPASLGDVVLLDQGIFAVKRDGVEVEIEGCAALETDLGRGVEPEPHPLRVAAWINPRAVLRQQGSLRRDVESREEREALVEDIAH